MACPLSSHSSRSPRPRVRMISGQALYYCLEARPWKLWSIIRVTAYLEDLDGKYVLNPHMTTKRVNAALPCKTTSMRRKMAPHIVRFA